MTSPSSDPDIFLRPLRAGDLARVSALESELFGPGAWSRNTLRDELENPGRMYTAAVEHHPGGGERLVGYAGIALAEDAEIMTVGVAPAYRRRGVATRMMRSMLATAARLGSERVLLEVRADDRGAQSLYLGAGFQPIGRRPGYYGSHGGDAVVMARTLHTDADGVRRSSALVDPGYLEAELDGAAPPVVLDVRWWRMHEDRRPALDAFRAGHIPGARFVDMEEDLCGPDREDPTDYPLPEPAELERRARAWGVENGRPVVVTDEYGGEAAARAWWLLRWAGFPDVRVLCSGNAGWREMDLPEETGDPRPITEGDVTLPLAHGAAPGMSVAAAEELTQIAADGALLDVRPRPLFEGVDLEEYRGGHVPGAKNLPNARLVDDDGHVAPTSRLRAVFADAGMDPDRPDARWTLQCGTGMTAPYAILALDLLGVRGRLYPGSWNLWVRGGERPVERAGD